MEYSTYSHIYLNIVVFIFITFDKLVYFRKLDFLQSPRELFLLLECNDSGSVIFFSYAQIKY